MDWEKNSQKRQTPIYIDNNVILTNQNHFSALNANMDMDIASLLSQENQTLPETSRGVPSRTSPSQYKYTNVNKDAGSEQPRAARLAARSINWIPGTSLYNNNGSQQATADTCILRSNELNCKWSSIIIEGMRGQTV